LGFANAKGGITLEPTLYLDQKSVYLNHLHELRRISEGDDTADSPGYALNLVRFPVSVLPGRRTEKGYGAEVTMTLRPHLNDELLPTTFRNLVLNDLVDQIAFPVTQFINNPDYAVYLDKRATEDVADLFSAYDVPVAVVLPQRKPVHENGGAHSGLWATCALENELVCRRPTQAHPA
jgi:hypothetical protein